MRNQASFHYNMIVMKCGYKYTKIIHTFQLCSVVLTTQNVLTKICYSFIHTKNIL